MLAKLVGVAVLIWFYQSANKAGENPIKWAIFGAVGFFLIATVLHYAVSEPVLSMLTPKSALSILVSQLPIVGGLAAVYLIRLKHLNKKTD